MEKSKPSERFALLYTDLTTLETEWMKLTDLSKTLCDKDLDSVLLTVIFGEKAEHKSVYNFTSLDVNAIYMDLKAEIKRVLNSDYIYDIIDEFYYEVIK
jgi:hypothetical protein